MIKHREGFKQEAVVATGAKPLQVQTCAGREQICLLNVGCGDRDQRRVPSRYPTPALISRIFLSTPATTAVKLTHYPRRAREGSVPQDRPAPLLAGTRQSVIQRRMHEVRQSLMPFPAIAVFHKS